MVQSENSGHNQTSSYFSKIHGVGWSKNLVGNNPDRISSDCFLEYAVMMAVILVLVAGTVRLIGSSATNTFATVGSSITQYRPILEDSLDMPLSE